MSFSPSTTRAFFRRSIPWAVVLGVVAWVTHGPLFAGLIVALSFVSAFAGLYVMTRWGRIPTPVVAVVAGVLAFIFTVVLA